MTTTTNLTTLHEIAVRELRRALVSDDVERTAHIRAVAEAYVEARGHFYNKNGEPDWGGRTYAYRTWVRDVTGEAQVNRDDPGNIQAAIRYHIGNILRERLSEDELTAHNLRPISPRERSVEKREGTSAALSLLHGGAPLDTEENIVSAAKSFARSLRRVRLDDLTEEERNAARSALLDLAAEAVRRAG